MVSAPVSFLEKETGVGCRICTEDKLASITLGVTARLIGSERAWLGPPLLGVALKIPGYLGNAVDDSALRLWCNACSEGGQLGGRWAF